MRPKSSGHGDPGGIPGRWRRRLIGFVVWCGLSAPAAGSQPPGEQPPARPPGEQPPTEGEASPEQPPAEGETPPEQPPAESETPTEPEAGTGEEAAAPAPPPRGILPGALLAAPTPSGGSPVVRLFLGGAGFFAQTGDGEVLAYAKDGARALWGASSQRAVFTAAHENRIVILDDTGRISLRSAADGRLETAFATGLAPEGEGQSNPPAAFSDGILYFVSGGRLHGVETESGRPVLEAPLPDGGAAALVPVLSAAPLAREGPPLPSLLLASLRGGGLAAIGTVAGRVLGGHRWRGGDDDPVLVPALALVRERLAIFGDLGGDLRALDLQSGRERWRWRLAESFRVAPLEERGRLYVATEANSLYSYNARGGGERWRAALPGRPAAPPIRIGETLLVVTRDGLLIEFEPATGTQIGAPTNAGAEVVGAVLAVPSPGRPEGRRLFLGLRDGRLSILGPAGV